VAQQQEKVVVIPKREKIWQLCIQAFDSLIQQNVALKEKRALRDNDT
jgi:hypothetical protein